MDPYFSPYTKLKSKWIKDLNIKTETLNLLEDRTGETLEDIGVGKDDFLNIHCTRNNSKNQQMGLYETGKLRYSKRISRVKTQLQNGKDFFASYSPHRGLISIIYN